MDPNFLTFARYNDEILAQEIAVLLKTEGITVQLEDTLGFFDVTFANNPLQREVSIKMHPRDFSNADEILLSYYEKRIDDLEDDYPLLSFSNEELQEILSKPDEWGRFDFVLAKKLLRERGLPIEDEALKELKTERNEKLKEPIQTGAFTLILYYLSTLMFPFITIFIGLFMIQSKITLPDGTYIKRYNVSDRLHGRIIIGISLFILISLFVFNSSTIAFFTSIFGL